MYKCSMFNNYVEYNEKIIIFNSFSKKIIITHKKDEIKNLRNNECTLIEDNFLKKLYRDGFITINNDDEINKANLFNYDDVYENILNLIIMPTEKCNFRCKYCYEDFSGSEMSKDVQCNLIDWFKKNIVKYNGVEVSWFGGEPLVSLDVLNSLSSKMLEICHEKGIRYSSTITTNGYLLSIPIFKKMLKNRIYNFQITIDGLENTHDKLRYLKGGEGSFSNIIQNLRNIRDNVGSNIFNINIRTNVSKDLVPEIHNYMAFMHNEFGNDKRFGFYFRPIGNWGGDNVKEIQKDLTKDIDEFYDIILKSKIKLNFTPYKQMLYNGMCIASKRNSFIIRSNGAINKCTMLLNEDQNHIGDLMENGLMKIDYSKLSKWLKNNVNNENCVNCSKRPSCNSRTCPAKGFLLNEDGKCGYENSYIMSILKILAKSELLETY